MKYHRELIEIILLSLNLVGIVINTIFKNWFALFINVGAVIVLAGALLESIER